MPPRPSATFRIAAAFALALATLLVAAAVSYVSLTRVASANRWVARTQEVRAALVRTRSVVQDAETGQRGYLITGDVHYLDPYRIARRDLPERFAQLDSLTRDNPEQQRLVAELNQSIT